MSHHQQAQRYYPLAQQRISQWYGNLPEMETILAAAECWNELVDLFKSRGWHNITPALVAWLVLQLRNESETLQ